MAIDKLFAEVVDEFANLKETHIVGIINKNMGKVKIKLNNLDNDITDFIMKNAGTGNEGITIMKDDAMYALIPECGEKPIVFHPNTEKIISDIYEGNNVYLYGDAGTGKTFLAKLIAKKRLGRGFRAITCSQWTSPIDIIGGETIKGYRQGVMVEAWKHGNILILDELPKLDPNTAGLLNEALAQTADKESMCPIFYKGDLEIGTTVWAKDKNGNQRFVSGVWGIPDAKSPDKFTYFWIEKQNKTEGKIVIIEEDFDDLEDGDKPKKGFKSGEKVQEFVTITDGRGMKQPKHPKFGVIATGNTNMKTVSGEYSGNNRQDYSLVDRFSGSFYKITFEDSKPIECQLVQSKVREICDRMRGYLTKVNAVESISLRTMLNMNRTYEFEMLIENESPIIMSNGVQIVSPSEVKTLKFAVNSFLESMDADMAEKMENETKVLDLCDELSNTPFRKEFIRIHGVDPDTGDKVSKTDEQQEAEADACKI